MPRRFRWPGDFARNGMNSVLRQRLWPSPNHATPFSPKCKLGTDQIPAIRSSEPSLALGLIWSRREKSEHRCASEGVRVWSPSLARRVAVSAQRARRALALPRRRATPNSISGGRNPGLEPDLIVDRRREAHRSWCGYQSSGLAGTPTTVCPSATSWFRVTTALAPTTASAADLDGRDQDCAGADPAAGADLGLALAVAVDNWP